MDQENQQYEQGPAADEDGQANAPKKVKGIAQMVAGGVVAAAGIPMLVLPGPGMAALAAGTVLATKGYADFKGENLEEDPDYMQGHQAGAEVTARMRDFAAEEIAPLADDAKESAAGFARDAASAIREGAKGAGSAAFDLAQKGYVAAKSEDKVQAFKSLAIDDLAPAGIDAAKAVAVGAWSGAMDAGKTAKNAFDTGKDLFAKGVKAAKGEAEDEPIVITPKEAE